MAESMEQEATEVLAVETQQDATGSETAETQEKAAGETAPEEATGETEAKKPHEKTAEEKERDRRGFEARESRRRQEREEAERIKLENAELKGRLKAIEEYGLKKPEKEPAKAPEEDFAAEFARQNPKPAEDAFEFNGDYVEAVADWKLKQRDFVTEKKAESKRTAEVQTAAKTEQQKAAEATGAAIKAQHDRGVDKYGEEFMDVIQAIPGKEFSQPMVDAVLDSEIGEDIAYYLGTNPAERQRIAALPPVKQIKEMGKIESGIASGTIKTKVTTTTAPPPPPRVAGAKAPVNAVDVSKMTDAEYGAYKRKLKLESSA